MNAGRSLALLSRTGLWRGAYWSFAALVLVVPATAKLLVPGMGWTSEDFVAAGAMTGATGLILELALRASNSQAYRLAAAMGLAAAFLLVWVDGAVGIIGDEGNPANLLFACVLAVALVGSLLARLRPAGMARAMIAAAGTQMLVFIAAWSFELGFVPYATLFWCALWAGSATLFARAARLQGH